MQMAVSIINNSTEILPDIYVDILRINNHDIENDDLDSVGSKSLGYAVNKVYNLMKNTSVSNEILIAVGGPDFPTLSTGRIWDYYDVSYCAMNQASSQFSNKKLYPRFMNMIPNLWVNSVIKLFKYMKVTRFAYLYGSNLQLDTKLFQNSGISVLSSINVVKETDLSQVFDILKKIDVRYIVVICQSDITSNIYFTAKQYGMLSPEYVWIGTNFPIADDYGPTAKEDIIGFLFFYPDLIFKGDAQLLLNYEALYNNLTKLNPER
jgi:hypothetical protein